MFLSILYFFAKDNQSLRVKGLNMFKKIIVLLICLHSLEANIIPASCACLLSKSQDHICYIGSLDLKLKQTEQLSLYYDGNIVKVNNGVYCFKEHKDVKNFYFLFINPESIRFMNERDNAGSYLTFTNNVPYDFYRLKQVNAVTLNNEPFIDWSIRRKPMPKEHKNGLLRVIIPNHTLIIPLDAQYFSHTQQKTIAFKYDSLKGNRAVIKLPTPQCSTAIERENFIEALLQANLCIINLKNIHSPQEIKKIRMDNHTLMQESS